MSVFDRGTFCPRRRLQYDEKLKNSIVPIFAHYVDPEQFLALVNKYSTENMSKPDEDHIRAVTQSKGDWKGASLLLEKLTKYQDWFMCMLLVLRDEEMKRGHIADRIMILKDNLDNSTETQDVQDFDGPHPADPTSFHPCPSPDVTPDDCVNDFNLNYEESLPSEDGLLETDAPKRLPVKTPSVVPETTNEYETAHDYETIDESMDLRESAGAKAPALPPLRSHFKVDKATKNLTTGVRTHGAQYDFTVEEVKSSLGQVEGWVDLSRETEIWNKLCPLRRENGHYLMWFWPKKKRPAIFVTHDGQVKSYIIHKRPDADFGDQVAYYFIYKDQRKEPTMRALVDFHVKNGLIDKNADGQRTLVTLTKAVEP